MDFSTSSKIVISHALFAGEQLTAELDALGFQVKEQNRLNVITEGTLNDCILLNLKLRTAHRVLYHLAGMRAVKLDDLYWKIKKVDWASVIPVDGYFSISSFVNQQGIRDMRIVNLKAKDAIADQFMSKFNKRPDSGSERSKTVLFLHWSANHCDIFVDTSGESIARHGYRKFGWKAPLLEALAASIIMKTAWKPEDQFVNPMCGSGTLAIEAALMATGRYPGLYRKDFGFQHIIGYKEKIYYTVVSDLKKNIKESLGSVIVATDHHGGAIDCARKNAELAGVSSLIRFEVCDFRKTNLPPPPGILILNPEYGERLGEINQLSTTYQAIGDDFKQRASGYMGYIFTGNPNLGKKIGLRTNQKIPFMNGDIECRLLEYELYSGTKKGVS